ncbi:hypothetical protein K1J57_20720 [Nocardiopsis sp. MT53]|uniref:Phage holin family protein n=2 Tax=Nocardiopsis changdeensis TaxID=2831969 RepID=A0ABX8BRB4_9ACTN|nr:hypothetical protein KGD84_11275 [Nocardiopsis changdeensis]QYX35169.1 hypothetical protein K1J57_20720 [Nocardiopsis sp. MT53]
MAATAQESLTVSKRPRRVGWMRYGLWWFEQAAAGARGGIRSLARGAGKEMRRAAGLTAKALPAGLEKAEAEPWDDRRLFVGLTAFSVVALALALLLGFGVAEWMRTEAGALPIVGVGALAVGVVLACLAYVVFASRQRRPRAGERE